MGNNMLLDIVNDSGLDKSKAEQELKSASDEIKIQKYINDINNIQYPEIIDSVLNDCFITFNTEIDNAINKMLSKMN
jgi:hypothetical protein